MLQMRMSAPSRLIEAQITCRRVAPQARDPGSRIDARKRFEFAG